MRIPACLPVAAALAAAWLLLLPPDARAYTVIGGTLSLDQRHVRIFENFSDPEANDNTSPDPSFPGGLGARLAIWKGAVEWGSLLHGDGNLDPTQPGDLGSGLANFDYAWSGLAPDIGSTDANVNSELSGSAGGVLAYTETPISDGWRIRYYSGWVWEDGPSDAHANIDLQGVACHELGHALGLGHSSASGATMQAFISGNGSAQRSIAADDIAGVQALYGALAPGKPRVTGYSVAAGQLAISGTGFSPLNNQIWFTRAAPAFGAPLKLTGIASSAGGTLLSAPLPAEAGPGDLLVRNDGTSGANLSNAFPFDPAGTVPNPPALPTLASIAPASMQVLGATQAQLFGSGLATVKLVRFGATNLTAPGGFQVVSDTQLQLFPPPASALGPVSVSALSSVGPSNAIAFTWTATNPPKLIPGPLAVSGQPFTWTAGAGANQLALLGIALSPSTVPFEGFDLLATAVLLPAKTLNALGLNSFTAQVPLGATGITFYGQCGVVDLAAASFVGASNITTTLVAF